MSWQPLIPNVDDWKNHFLTTAKMKYIPNQKTYIVGQFGEGSASTKPQIELVTHPAGRRQSQSGFKEKKTGRRSSGGFPRPRHP